MTIAAPVLAARVLPRSRLATAIAVIGFAGLTALAARFSFLVPPIEVPFTLQTMAVLLAGGVLGSKLGAASQALYLIAGSAGLPVFAENRSGYSTFTEASGGYLVGFVVAAFVVGKMAERRHDRMVLTGFAAFLIGSLVIYLFGVIGLMVNVGLDFGAAVAGGVVPFVFWDVLKALAAGVALPAAWKATGEGR